MRWFWLSLVALVALVLAVLVGPAGVSLESAMRGLLGHGDPAVIGIVRGLRVPRALLAFAVGGSLAVAGAALQAVVRNPLADPYLLGLSGGAGLGAVLSIALRFSGAWALPLSA